VKIYTRRGDDGSTGLLYGGRISKAHLRTEAYGTTDEAVAALGAARAFVDDAALAELLLRLQRQLFVAGAELATAPANAGRLVAGQTRVDASMVDELEALIDDYSARTRMPEEFVVPGESKGSALLDLARTVVRRAERRVVELASLEELPDSELVRWLNRLSDLLFVLARYEERGFTPLRGD